MHRLNVKAQVSSWRFKVINRDLLLYLETSTCPIHGIGKCYCKGLLEGQCQQIYLFLYKAGLQQPSYLMLRVRILKPDRYNGKRHSEVNRLLALDGSIVCFSLVQLGEEQRSRYNWLYLFELLTCPLVFVSDESFNCATYAASTKTMKQLNTHPPPYLLSLNLQKLLSISQGSVFYSSELQFTAP